MTSYEDDPDSSNSTSFSPNFSTTPELEITKSRNKSGVWVTEKESKMEGQVKHTVKKLYSGSADVYLK